MFSSKIVIHRLFLLLCGLYVGTCIGQESVYARITARAHEFGLALDTTLFDRYLITPPIVEYTNYSGLEHVASFYTKNGPLFMDVLSGASHGPFPNVDCSVIIATLSDNTQDHLFFSDPYTPEEARAYFGCDWALKTDLTLKKDIRKEGLFHRLFFLWKEGQPYTVVVLSTPDIGRLSTSDIHLIKYNSLP